MRIDDLHAKRDEADSELALLAAKTVMTKGEQERWDRTVRQRDRVVDQIRTLEERNDNVRAIAANPDVRMTSGTPYGDTETYDRTRVNNDQAAALRSLEHNAGSLSTAAADRVDGLIRSGGADTTFARWVEVHGRPEYSSAFGKILAAGDPGVAATMLDDHERAAMSDSFRVRSERAQSEGSSGGGGYAIPVFIDPSVILADQESSNPFLNIARTVDIQTNAWKGVSSAGVSWSFDAEASAVSDDSLTSLVQPTVTVFMARGFVPYSIEVSEDWPGFQAEMARLLAVGYDELLVDKFSRGSGSGEPKGILTALAASSPTVIVTSTTDGAFGQEDIYATWNALPQKFRRRASWMMSVDVMSHIRQMGTSNVYHALTVTLPAGAIDKLMESPVYESPYFPALSSTTGAANRLVVGDFNEFVIARRTGMTAELVPHLLDTSTGRPTGSRGFFAYGRIGSNSTLDGAFRMQSNT